MEFVYVVPREELFPHGAPQGFQAFGDASNADLHGAFLDLVQEKGFFVERSYAERTPAWKQIIPYVVVRTDEDDERILLLRRTKGGGEARLHDKLSIGVGGHINPEDLEGPEESRDVISAGTRRELNEELVIEGDWNAHPVGILNDDSNPVGAVHVGLVQVVTVAGSVSIREHDQLEGRCVRPQELEDLLASKANIETWSELLIRDLDRVLAPAHDEILRTLPSRIPSSSIPSNNRATSSSPPPESSTAPSSTITPK